MLRVSKIKDRLEALGVAYMTDVCLVFEVHQPLRLNRNFNSDLLASLKVEKGKLLDLYFDHGLNKHIFNRVTQKCYFPANSIILDQIDRFKRGRKQFKVAFSLSGVFVEQCEKWNPSLLDSFQQLAKSSCVELLDQTYYHSLTSLYGIDRSEFVEQINLHRQLIRDFFDCEPRVFVNTECLYNNSIAKTVDGLGYKAIITEGVERVLDWRSPNFVYNANESALCVLLRNYRLSDDIGFRFSSTLWNEWPINADKYANWLAATPGQVILIFMDYETFGEHQWPDTGIHQFLRWLPAEVIKWDDLHWRTPSEVIQRHKPVGEINVHEYNTISWADLERDPSAWIDNPMQRISYNLLRELEPLVKGIGDETLIRLWRYLQMSDHLYYMSTKGGSPGDVHNYFNPYGSPSEAFSVFSRILSDLEARILKEMEKPELVAKRILRPLPPGKGFTFFYEFARPTKWIVHSLEEFFYTLKTLDLKSIRFHMERGDFERWIRQVVGDKKLSDDLTDLSNEELTGEFLRKRILETVKKRIVGLVEISSKTATNVKQD